ncbi:hypothetical protein N7G274_009005 [Stereocaulon virgatum]|uniref:AmmeMemoRadiSam system protein B n=1 Tax=Stereocaulon virgatum TaxID=373712 RepID=A0ABR4A039_9LECA
MGNLTLDTTTIAKLRSSTQFKDMSTSSDSAEHSLEMHLPYIYHLLGKCFKPSTLPPLVPILVGSTEPTTEKAFGALLAPYLADSSNVFVISSDFCHWGSRFNYTYYLVSDTSDPSQGVSLNRKDHPKGIPIYESIARIDRLAMQGIETGHHDAFLATLQDTGNTVCGRHPIGVIIAAIEVLKQQGTIEKGMGNFHFVRYERSSEVVEPNDSSVSYASAFAVL